MRTQEQIKNCRRLLLTMFGYYAMFLKDVEVDIIMNRLEATFSLPAKEWDVVIRFVGDRKELSEIESQKTTDKMLYRDAVRRCESLLTKYPKIDAIRIVEHANPSNFIDVTRKEQENDATRTKSVTD